MYYAQRVLCLWSCTRVRAGLAYGRARLQRLQQQRCFRDSEFGHVCRKPRKGGNGSVAHVRSSELSETENFRMLRSRHVLIRERATFPFDVTRVCSQSEYRTLAVEQHTGHALCSFTALSFPLPRSCVVSVSLSALPLVLCSSCRYHLCSAALHFCRRV